ncbi:secreted protein acidic and rich in cysteine Ca-binding region protein (macronuclear) [Tetrahymena thermophila SB210]|uniref:Secreted protein acidic and rich in cysteine Ca-binding region protein n=1 Tax=Tetrahymena thermophila (strain SB210) TaxID=312017 RepID=W7XG98_TETTS|nr:secreted protein acidic and rich in cysteine Ca-binding region protein [Tetrahymena thermophila SB210]EWS75953.1 secreted protein acidic and rich in cysteine Ca-binding region protein [Tetrahymena thermophila SB210]|eukprot:XP_012651471.1 secreted protein acidic and rich in cysteine Ca-binding region protein [Tetrahymena thermophila SB210]
MAELRELLKDDHKVKQIAIAAFNTVDTDKSGYIDLDELEALMKDMAGQLNIQAPTKHEVSNAFKEIDADKDKRISLEEFTVMVREILRLMAGL